MHDSNLVLTGQDFERAALVFQHGDTPDDSLAVHLLAMTALGKGATSARWLAAATLNRYLQKVGQPRCSALNMPTKWKTARRCRGQWSLATGPWSVRQSALPTAFPILKTRRRCSRRSSRARNRSHRSDRLAKGLCSSPSAARRGQALRPQTRLRPGTPCQRNTCESNPSNIQSNMDLRSHPNYPRN